MSSVVSSYDWWIDIFAYYDSVHHWWMGPHMLTVYDNENILCERSEHGGWELMKSNLKHIKYNAKGEQMNRSSLYLGKELGYIIYLIMNYLFDMYWWQITRWTIRINHLVGALGRLNSYVIVLGAKVSFSHVAGEKWWVKACGPGTSMTRTCWEPVIIYPLEEWSFDFGCDAM